MDLPPLVVGRFVRRVNRFLALVSLDGRETEVHVANSGRMRELLAPDAPCYLARRGSPGRRTAYDLTLVAVEERGRRPTLVSADARLPNALVWEAWASARLPGFEGYETARREVTFGDSRMDLLLEGLGRRCLIEMKSVTLVEGGVGVFPDAPTDRGRRHVETLAGAMREGYRAVVLFVIQRGDAVALAPNDATDPAFGAALRAAARAGMEVRAFTCRVAEREVTLSHEVPVRL